MNPLVKFVLMKIALNLGIVFTIRYFAKRYWYTNEVISKT